LDSEINKKEKDLNEIYKNKEEIAVDTLEED
jgi:hypothetical protein